MERATKLLLVALLVGACTPARQGTRAARAQGPDRVQVEVVQRHAEQFDDDLPRRTAGSQQEEAAAAYVLGHLQRAGYVARLEAVPVADTVNSTDVIAVAPHGADPSIVVAVPYDTGPDADRGGASLGVFLELSRALAVARPRHSVGFAALGAEQADVEGGLLGSRRLARLLVDEGARPLVLTLEGIGMGEGFGAVGSEAPRLLRRAEGFGVKVMPPATARARGGEDLTRRTAIFAAARLDHVGVTGGAAQVGPVLLKYLTEVDARASDAD